jgi:hypothetical protein
VVSLIRLTICNPNLFSNLTTLTYRDYPCIPADKKKRITFVHCLQYSTEQLLAYPFPLLPRRLLSIHVRHRHPPGLLTVTAAEANAVPRPTQET